MDREKLFKNKFAVAAIALFCCLLLGSAFPVLKILYTRTQVVTISQKILLAGIRFTIAGTLVLIFSKLILKKSLKVEKSNIKYIVTIALVQTFLAYSFYYLGLPNTTAVRASIIVSLGIFNVAILSLFMFKDFKLTSNKIIGMILGLAGVIIVNLSAFSGGQGISFLGEGFIFINSVLMSLASILIKKYSDKMDIVLLNGYQLLLGGILLTTAAVLGNPEPIQFDPVSIALLAYMSLVSAVAFSLWNQLLRFNQVASITLYKFTIPIFGTILAILLLPDENFTFVLIPSLVLIAIGIVYFIKGRSFLRNRE